jgi:hypothetical protein
MAARPNLQVGLNSCGTLRGVDARRIVAMGGGGFSMERDNPLLNEFVLSLAHSSRPRVCSLPTARGDADSFEGENLSEVVASRPEAARARSE